ncbi:MAG: efflux RND transporter permease subunit, partial [Lentisphaeria bacterium]|nr:efflux RND transporter permease subunit [Lentisphaeria bacterium]
MNPAKFALEKRTVVVVLTILLVGGGILSYRQLGRLEDPTFTIKTALIVTPYPGATPEEVEEEVTDVLEEAIQSMGQLKEIRSISQQGLSLIFADMKDTHKSRELPQIWDELRRKIHDVQGQLPPGAGPSRVNDDFGDVYGVFFAITGSGHTYAQLKEYAKDLKKELLLCENVAKIDFWGMRQEVIYIEFERAKMSEMGLSPTRIFETLRSQNVISPSGMVEVDGEYLRIAPTGEFQSEETIADLLIGGGDNLVRLGDVATVRRGYLDPPRAIMRFNGQPAIGLGVSTVSGGNVIVMGEAVRRRLKELESKRPLGMKVNTVSFQSDNVTEAVDKFITNLVEAVLIVVVLLMIFMGWQSGLLIGAILLLTILGTFIGMNLMDIELQKISLGALILALGMLVDNAIVVADGILVKVERGKSRDEAACETVRDTQWPLLGATLVAILAFAAIGFAPGTVGEFCRTLFDVMALSLSLSWVLAVTVAPLFCVWFLRIPDLGEEADPYDRPMFRVYRRFLHSCLRMRWHTVAVTLCLLLVAMVGFRRIPHFFFANSTRAQFYVDYWRPQGTHILRTDADLKAIAEHIRGLEGVTNVTTFAGEGALRFVLSYDYQTSNTAYGQVLVDVDDYHVIDERMAEIEAWLQENFPDSEPFAKKFVNGPAMSFRVIARFRGPDEQVLQRLANQAAETMRAHPETRDVRTDWRQRTRVIRPVFAEAQARRIGVTRDDLTSSLQWTYGGIPVGVFREGDELIPIYSRPPEAERSSVEDMRDIQVWSRGQNRAVPLRQVVTGVETVWEAPIIMRRDRERTISVQCNPVGPLADPVFRQLRPAIEAIDLPTGYSLEWGGEYEESRDAQTPLKQAFPICFLGMFVITVCLFNSVRRPLIIFLCL